MPIAEKRREEHEQFDIFYFYDLVYYADRKKQTEGYRAEIHLALLQHAREALIPQRPAEQKNPLMKAQWHFKRPQPDQGQAAVHPVWATAPLALTAVHRLLLPQRRIWNGKRRRMPGIMRRKSARNRRVSIRKPADVWSACGIMSGTAFRRETGLSSATIAVQRI